MGGRLRADRRTRARLSRHQLRALPFANRPGAHLGAVADAATLDPRRLGVCKPPVAAGRRHGRPAVSTSCPAIPIFRSCRIALASTDPGAMMPELGRSLEHTEGVALIAEWITHAERRLRASSTTPPGDWPPMAELVELVGQRRDAARVRAAPARRGANSPPPWRGAAKVRVDRRRPFVHAALRDRRAARQPRGYGRRADHRAGSQAPSPPRPAGASSG